MAHAISPSPLTESLRRTQLFQDYQSAFEQATGLPLHLKAADGAAGQLKARPRGNPFCQLMAGGRQSCAACLALQQRLENEGGTEPWSRHCFAGLCESAVPVRAGDKVVAFLQTRQILLHRPDAEQFRRVTQLLREWGPEVDLKQAEAAWFSTPVLTIAITVAQGSRRNFQADRTTLDCGSGSRDFHAGCPGDCRKSEDAVVRHSQAGGETVLSLRHGTASLTATALNILCEAFIETGAPGSTPS